MHLGLANWQTVIKLTMCVQSLRKYDMPSSPLLKLILRQNFLLDECNFLSENKLVAEAGKHHMGKQKGEQLFTLPTFRTLHRQAIALILKKSPKNLEIQHFEHANS